MTIEKSKKEETWEEVVRKYPSRWVLFSKANLRGSDVVSGQILAVVTDDELQDYLDNHYNEIAFYSRTTEDCAEGGYIHGDLVKA